MQQEQGFFKEAEPQQLPLQLKRSAWQFQKHVQQINQLPFLRKSQSHHSQQSQKSSQNLPPEVSHQLRRMIYRYNIQKYCYSRSYHYYFDLNQFERDPSSISYARDPENVMKSTFSKDEKKYKDSRLRDIINREYFILPLTQNTIGSRPSNCKNPSHDKLFDNQDKKIYFDRLIINIRYILNNLQQLIQSKKLQSFSLIYRDPFLQKILNNTLSISQKRNILINRLQNIISSKRLSEKQWKVEDNIYYSSSYNQQHYIKMKNNFINMSKRILISCLYNNHYYQEQIIKNHQNINIDEFIQSIFKYSKQKQYCISQNNLQQLINNCKLKLINNNKNNLLINFPIQILSFGNQQIIDIVCHIFSKRLIIYKQKQYYYMDLLFKKIFKKGIKLLQDDLNDQYLYKLQASQFINKIRLFIQSNIKQKQQKIILDDLLNLQELQNQQKEIFVFKRKYSIQLSSQEFITVLLIHYLCLILKQMYPFISQNRQFIQIISSQQYQRINQAVSEAFKNTLIGSLSCCINQILANITQQNHINFTYFKVQLDYHFEKNTGILWRINQPINTQNTQNEEQNKVQSKKQSKQYQQNNEQYDIFYCGKRRKSDQSNIK